MLFTLNPVYCFITVARWAMMGGELDPAVIASGTVWAIVLCIGGFLFFRAAEERYARV